MCTDVMQHEPASLLPRMSVGFGAAYYVLHHY